MKKYILLPFILFFITTVVYAGASINKTISEYKLEKVARKYSKSKTTQAKERFVKTYKQLFLQDSLYLSELLEEGSKKSWYAYKSTLNKMKERQVMAQSIGVKCDNYDYDYSLQSAKEYFAKVNAQKGEIDLQNAKITHNRNLAQKAYEELVFAYQISGNEALMQNIEQARKESKKHLLITVNNRSDVALPEELKQQILSQFESGEYKDMVVSTKIEPGEMYDFIVSVTIDDIYIENYWSGYWGANRNFDVYEKGFISYTAPHNFRLGRVMRRGIAAKAVRNNIVMINLKQYLTPYEQALLTYNQKFMGHVPLFRLFNIEGKYELINVRAKQVIAQEPLKFYRKISPSTLIPLMPGDTKNIEMMKFAAGFYQSNLPR